MSCILNNFFSLILRNKINVLFKVKQGYKTLLCFGILALISGCSSVQYNVQPINGRFAKNDKIVLNDVSIYIVNGGNASMKTFTSTSVESEEAMGSGLAAINIAYKKFFENTANIISEKYLTLEDKALEIGAINESDYLVYSRVEKWTDPFGMNCGPLYHDEASVLLSLYAIK